MTPSPRYISYIQQIIAYLRRFLWARKYIDIIINDQDLNEIVKGSGIALFFKTISLPMGVMISLIISRRYGAEAMGIYGLMIMIIGIVSALGLLGLSSAMARFVGESKTNHPDDPSRIYISSVRIIILSGIGLSVLLYVLAGWIAIDLFAEPKLVFPLQIASLFIFPHMRKLLNESYLIAHKKIIHAEFISKIIMPASLLIIIFASYQLWPTYYIPVRAYLISSIIGLGVSLWMLYGHSYVALSGRGYPWAVILSISRPMMITGLGMFVMRYTDIMMLGFLSDTGQVGIYTVAATIASVILIPYQLVHPIFSPKISELYRSKDRSGFAKILSATNKINILLSLVIVSILGGLGGWIISRFGTEFVGTTIVLWILCLNMLIDTASSPVRTMFNNCGAEKLIRNSLIVSAILNLILNFALIPVYGIVGAAIATTISFGIVNLWLIWRGREIVKKL